VSVVTGDVPDSVCVESLEDPVYEEADKHFLATHNHPGLTLSHLIIRNSGGVTMARWEGISVSS